MQRRSLHTITPTHAANTRTHTAVDYERDSFHLFLEIENREEKKNKLCSNEMKQEMDRKLRKRILWISAGTRAGRVIKANWKFAVCVSSASIENSTIYFHLISTLLDERND